MSVVDQLVNDAAQIRRMEGPGARLKAAREARGLGRARAASQLHLGEDIVAALESDQYEGLPGSVFVRGYLRNYARLLGLPEAPLLEAYAADKPSESVYVPAADSIGIRKEKRLGDGGTKSSGGSRWVTWSLVVVVVGAGALWWFDGRDDATANGDRLVSGPTLELASPALKSEAPGAEAVPSADIPAVTAPVSMADGTEEIEQATPERETPLAEVPPQATVAATPEPVAEAPGTETQVAAVQAPTPGAAQDPAQAQAPSHDAAQTSAVSVVFEFRESCWVDVRDSTRRRQLFGVMKKGTRRILGGTPPYSVVLGNAPAVRITVDGEAYDIGSHTRGDVARFTLGS